MWFTHFSALRRRQSRRARRTPKTSYRLTIEPLEDRTVPSFLAPVSYPLGGGPPAVAVGDFTGTGVADLVVANAGGSVSVFLGNGDGTFAPAQNYAVGGGPESVAVGDFNNDGKLDIITANYLGFGGSTVSVLLGNGNGTFQPALNYGLPAGQTIPQRANALAVGDFNKDGKLDVAVVGNVYTTGYYDGTITPYVNVLIGNGTGGFSAETTYALTSRKAADGVVVGDFTGNDNLDLAVAKESGVDVATGKRRRDFWGPDKLCHERLGLRGGRR